MIELPIIIGSVASQAPPIWSPLVGAIWDALEYNPRKS